MKPPETLTPERLTRPQRRVTHMASALLLDYPDAAFRERLPVVRDAVSTIPPALGSLLGGFLEHAESRTVGELQRGYVDTFDLRRKCALYLTYYAAGDTRRRGTALVTFIEAYRAAGWEFDADELPDYLPAVLEFSARSESPIAERLLAAHRDGLEVLRLALTARSSPHAAVVEAVCRSLPPIDAASRERFLALVNEGPPTETVGLSFLGAIPPYAPAGAEREGARV